MSKYLFVKTKLQIAEELHKLWDNAPLYKFISGAQYIRKRELDIAECLVESERDDWIELCRTVWYTKQQEQTKKKKR